MLGWRKRMGWTQAMAAKRLGITIRAISRYECGAHKPRHWIVAKALRLEREKDAGIIPEQIARTPWVRRKLPDVKRGIGIAPSSF